MIRQEVNIAVLQRATTIDERRRGVVFAVGFKIDHLEGFREGQARGDRSLADLAALDVDAVDVAPELVGEFLHEFVRFRIILQTRRARGFRTKNESAFFDKRLNLREKFGAHCVKFGEDEDLILRAVREREKTVRVDARRFAQHFAVDEVELVSARERRIDASRHLRRVFADEIRDVRDVQTLLKHVVRAFKITDVEVELVEPRVVTVELVSEPRVDTRLAFVRLFDEEVQECVVDTVGEETIRALLHIHRTAPERITRASVRFRPNLSLTVNVTARGRDPVFDIAERAFAPVFPRDFVRLTAVLQEFAGEAPVTVTFEPRVASVFVAGVAQTADVRIGDFIRDKASQVPKEAIGDVEIRRDRSVEDGEVRGRVVTERLLEFFGEVVGVVLTAHFVAVLDDRREGFHIFGGEALDQIEHIRVEVFDRVFAAHLVDFKSRRFRNGGGVLCARRGRAEAFDDPFSFGNVPGQDAVFALVGEIEGFRGIVSSDGVVKRGLRFLFPLIFRPHRVRGLMHFGESLVEDLAHDGRRENGDARQGGVAVALDDELEVLRGRRVEARGDGRVGDEAYVELGVVTGNRELDEEFLFAVDVGVKLRGRDKRLLVEFDDHAARREGIRRFELNRLRFVTL